jgi:caffeoyl-CoA O-methyltransferase
MSDLQSPTVLNPGVLIPVNPAIEDYMRSLLNHTDHAALIEAGSRYF